MRHFLGRQLRAANPCAACPTRRFMHRASPPVSSVLDVAAILEEHEDVSRWGDVRLTLMDAGIPAVLLEEHTDDSEHRLLRLTSAMHQVAVLPTSTGEADVLDALVMEVWKKFVSCLAPRYERKFAELTDSCIALSELLHRYDGNTSFPTAWMHLVLLRILRESLTANSLHVGVVEHSALWKGAMSRQQALWARDANLTRHAPAPNIRAAVVLHQFAFLKASDASVRDTAIGQLLTKGTHSTKFPQFVVDARVVACWGRVSSYFAEADDPSTWRSVWANPAKDNLAHVPIAQVEAINAQLSHIGRGSSASTVV